MFRIRQTVTLVRELDLTEGEIREHFPDWEGTARHLHRLVGGDLPPALSARLEALPQRERGSLRRVLELDTWSSASRQHYIDTGRYLRVGEAWRDH